MTFSKKAKRGWERNTKKATLGFETKRYITKDTDKETNMRMWNKENENKMKTKRKEKWGRKIQI